MGLEEDLKKLEEAHTKEEIEKRANLATQVTEVFRSSMMKFLGKKHGTKKVGDVEVPLMYCLGNPKEDYKGAEKDAEDMLNYIAENLLSYCFPDANEDEFKIIKKHILKNKNNLRGIVSSRLGINFNEVENLLVQYKTDLTKSEKLNEVMAHAGIILSSSDINDLYSNVLKKSYLKELKGYVSKKLEEKGYKIKGLEEADIPEIGQYLQHLYTGSLEQISKLPGSKIYKKEKK